MAHAALNWFLSFNPRNRARVDRFLRANFRSASQDVFDTVKYRVLRIRELLEAAQGGRLTFACAPPGDTACGNWTGYVRRGERGIIHICRPFFPLTLEGRRWMLIHECAHLAGAMTQPEHYYGFFGPVGTSECLRATPAATTRDALGLADNYARLVWCLVRQPGITVTPP
ncbi:MAG TPA: hypothetical protein ENJ19_05270 [Gammaproteobacteria bacterium]|nr:hypothetical protein [Gammaproteobacteria bacterium]